MRYAVARALTIAAGTVLLSQQRDAPMRETAPITGTSAIVGTVVGDDLSVQPVRRAIVTISGDLPASRSAITDDDGRFSFERLPAGQFTLTATKTAYLPVAYGATKPGRPGTPISLAIGQRATIAIRMARGAVLTGAVRDRSGMPVPGLEVTAVAVRTMASASWAGTPARDLPLTDDRGIYRVYGLMPGTYILRAESAFLAGAVAERSLSDMDAVLAALARRATVNPASAVTGTPAVGAPQTSGIAPVFFPGTPSVDEAVAVTVAAGEERAGLDFVFAPLHVSSMEGVVSGPVRSLAVVQLTVAASTQRGTLSGATNARLSVKPNATDGRFKFTGVAPGRYRILAKANPTQTEPDPAPTMQTMAVRSNVEAPVGGNFVYAVADVETRGEDITGVTLELRPGSTFAGRFQFDAATHQPPADLSRIRLSLAPPGRTSFVVLNGVVIGNTFGPVAPAAIGTDGSFRIIGIGPGSYELQYQLPAELGDTWTPRSAMAGGRDLLDSPIEFGPDINLNDVVITVSDRRTAVTGTLRASSGLPAAQYFVVAFPSDRKLWQAARRIKSVRPASNGTFTISDLPSGEYMIAALTDVEPADLTDAAFFEQLVPAAIKITLAEGEKKSQDLTIARR